MKSLVFYLPSQVLTLKQSPIAALKILPNPGSGTLAGDATNGKVINSQIPAVGAFYGVRLIYENWDTVNPMNIDGVKIAVSTATGGAGSSANNSALSFSSLLTFSGSTSIAIPVATNGSTKVICKRAITDFMPITSVARTDNSSFPPLLRVATHFAPSANQTVHPSYNGTNYTDLNVLAANTGFNYGDNSFTGTLAALGTEAQGTYDIYGGVQNPCGAIFYYSANVNEIAAFGDSLIQGVGSAANYAGWPAYLTYNSYTSSLKFSCANYGTSGQKTQDSLAIMKETLAKYKPKYAAFKAWSPNDGDTQAIYDTSFGYCLEGIAYCMDLGIVPIVLTSGPASGYTWSRIKAQNARVLALPASALKIDVANLVNNPASDGNIIPAYDSGDHTHYSDAGYIAISALIQTSISN